MNSKHTHIILKLRSKLKFKIFYKFWEKLKVYQNTFYQNTDTEIQYKI